jgi:hypothetical protein
MFISELDVVNACLATMGEAPLNTLNDDHVYKDAALGYLEEYNMVEQAFGYWFNREYLTLLPDSETAHIAIPQDVLEVREVLQGVWAQPAAVQRGNRAYNLATNSFEWTTPLSVEVVRLLPFEQLPFIAADLVKHAAILRFQREYDGDAQRYQEIGREYSRAYKAVRAQHIRHVRPNLLRTHSFYTKFVGASGRAGFPMIPTR